MGRTTKEPTLYQDHATDMVNILHRFLLLPKIPPILHCWGENAWEKMLESKMLGKNAQIKTTIDKFSMNDNYRLGDEMISI